MGWRSSDKEGWSLQSLTVDLFAAFLLCCSLRSVGWGFRQRVGWQSGGARCL